MKKININVKYSVTALIDLLGFSSHLEIGNYDFRTNIGQEAIKRLLVLEKTLSFLSEEKKKCPQVYPHKYYLQRINDSIILTMDLPDFLTPGVGETIRNGYSAYDLTEQFSEEELRTEETFVKA